MVICTVKLCIFCAPIGNFILKCVIHRYFNLIFSLINNSLSHSLFHLFKIKYFQIRDNAH